jgi:hypothetical protein
MLGFEKLAEKKINDWIKKEDFTKNHFYKKYVDNSEYFKAPPHIRITLHILKNAGVVPKKFQLKNEILEMKKVLLEITEENDFFKQLRRFNNMVAEFNILSKNKANYSNNEFYCKKLMKKILGFNLYERKNINNCSWLSQK